MHVCIGICLYIEIPYGCIGYPLANTVAPGQEVLLEVVFGSILALRSPSHNPSSLPPSLHMCSTGLLGPLHIHLCTLLIKFLAYLYTLAGSHCTILSLERWKYILPQEPSDISTIALPTSL